MRLSCLAAILSTTLSVASAPVASADEGMWTFDNFPSAKVRAAYGMAPDKAWLDRVRRNSVRLENGCSGAIVSGDGAVLTNHHCVTSCLADLSTPDSDLVANGFVSKGRRGERVCPGFEASILTSTADVTARVTAASASVPAAEVAAARAAEIARIAAESCGEDETVRCQVVELYKGARFHLYRYDRYSDIRIALAPEMQAGFFGGDPDNFNFPRYAFDMAVLRIYRNGQPLKVADPLRLSANAPAPGQPVFVSGHPGSTRRLMTLAQLTRERDHDLPMLIEYLAQLRGSLLTESAKGEEEARQALDYLQNIENAVKVYMGQRGALVEPAFFATKVAEEKRLRDALAADAALKAKLGDPFADIETVLNSNRSAFLPYQMLEQNLGAGSVLLADARTLVRGAAERQQPDGARLREFGQARLASVEASLLAQGAVHPLLERLQIEFWLNKTRERLGPDHPAVKELLGARTSAQIAIEIANASQVVDPSFRARLWRNPAEVARSNDPAIVLVRRLDTAAREARSDYETRVSNPLAAASARVAELRFAVSGEDAYPDATFTLRLSYGAVQGWDDPVFGKVEPFTYLAGLWTRATGAFPFNLAARWQAAKAALSVGTPMNFTTTNDIVGGSSGSPVLDAQGRVVGLAFDGNIHSLGGAYGFDAALNRTIALSTPVIIEAMRKVYGAGDLADELTD